MPWEDVCLSVRHTPVFCRNGCTYRQLFFSFSTFSIPNGMVILRRKPPNWGVECKGYEKVAIFDQYLALSLKRYNIELYLEWQAKCKSYMVYRTAPYSATLNDPYTPDFKVTPLFDAEYLRNSTIYRHSFNGILIGTYTHTQVCHFE